MPFNRQNALSYVNGINLAGTPRFPINQGAQDEAQTAFDEAKKQALVVGSGVFSFEQGVSPEIRNAISNAALLAQLVANKRADASQAPLDWFNAYLEVLGNVGWTIQEGGWADYSAGGNSAEVHEKILEVVSALYAGPALAIITASVNALKGMAPDSPWITLFNQETQKAKIARFQIGFTSVDANGDVFVSLVACLIQAETGITQVLFFKFKSANASFKANSAKISVNRDSITDLADTIRAKTREFQKDYLSSIRDL